MSEMQERTVRYPDGCGREDLLRAAEERHSVRRFTAQKIREETAALLNAEITKINADGDVSFALVTGNEEVFCAGKPHYGSFAGCRNFFALFAKPGCDEKVGYLGEQLVLYAQALGLNSCWVALTFEKKKMPIEAPAGMKLYVVIALGYGETAGKPHRSKPLSLVSKAGEDAPAWFGAGMACVMNAPTAVNQQHFRFTRESGRSVKARSFFGPCHKIDLGIVKYHFELGAGAGNFTWEV